MYIKYIIRSNSSSNLLEILTLFACLIDILGGYQMVSVEDDDSCLNLTNGNITLGMEQLSRLIVSLDNITTSEQQKGKWEDDFVCEFQVSASRSTERLFAVIQSIFLRKNYTTNECIDYVEYKSYDGTISEKYCGQMGIDYHLQANDTLVTTNPFAQQNPSSLNVHINISKTPLEPDENLELKIVFTCFGHCLQEQLFFDNWCREGFTVHCIATDFFGDDYFNCPYYRCSNESGCAKYADKIKTEVSPMKMRIMEISTFMGAITFITLIVCCVFLVGMKFRRRRIEIPNVVRYMRYPDPDIDAEELELHNAIPSEDSPPNHNEVESLEETSTPL